MPSIDYLSLNGLPYVVLAWLGLWVFRPFATLIHELGHGVVALIFTSSEVTVRAGRTGGGTINLFRRLNCEFSLLGGQEGCTKYAVNQSAKFKHLLILAGGPLSSFCFVFHSGYLLFYQSLDPWAEIPLISWFCCHSLTFLRSVIPMRLKPTVSYPDGPPSDGLQIFKLLFSQQKE